MSFESQVSELAFETDGVTTAFPLTSEGGSLFFMQGADIRAAYIDEDGVVTALANGSSFTVFGDGRIGAGTLNMASALAADGVLRIWCDTTIVQPEDYQEDDGFPAETHERAQDRHVMQSRDLARRIGRAVRVGDSDAPGDFVLPTDAERKNGGDGSVLAFDGTTGLPILSSKSLAQLNGYLDSAEQIASVASVIAALIAGQLITNFSLSIPVSICASLAAANATATSVGGELVLDKDATLTGAQSFTARRIRSAGGKITLGNYDATFNNNGLSAGHEQIFVQNGTGRVKGTIQAPEILADWWNDYANAASNRKALQSATDYVNQSVRRNADIVISGRQIFEIDQGIVSTGSDQPNFIGHSRLGSVTPDSLNFKYAPASAAVGIKMVGNSAPCGGGIHGVYFDGNANLTAIELNNCVGAELNVGFSTTVGRCIYLHNISGGYNENTKILATVPGLGTSSLFLDMDNGTGTNSFSGTQLLPGTAIALNPGNRGGVPVIKSRAGAFVYNGGIDCHLHNNGATNFAFYQNIAGGAAPTFLRRFNLAIETIVDGGHPTGYPVVVVDPAQEAIYGSVDGVFLQNGEFDDVIDISALIDCDYFAYPPGGVIKTKGAKVYQQRQTFFANDGVVLSPAFGGRDHIRYTGYLLSTSGSAYRYDFDIVICCDQSDGDTPGAATLISASLGSDVGTYGAPTLSMDATHRPKFSKGGFPAVQWIAFYSAEQMGP